jgi:hypothetical protein
MDEWVVEFSDEFDLEFERLSDDVKSSLIQHLNLLKLYGPQLSRPYADTLNGSIYPNMKELRFNAADGVWRVAFAFDPQRQAIILVAGDKAGQNQRKFYKQLIDSADCRYTAHLDKLKE